MGIAIVDVQVDVALPAGLIGAPRLSRVDRPLRRRRQILFQKAHRLAARPRHPVEPKGPIPHLAGCLAAGLLVVAGVLIVAKGCPHRRGILYRASQMRIDPAQDFGGCHGPILGVQIHGIGMVVQAGQQRPIVVGSIPEAIGRFEPDGQGHGILRHHVPDADIGTVSLVNVDVGPHGRVLEADGRTQRGGVLGGYAANAATPGGGVDEQGGVRKRRSVGVHGVLDILRKGQIAHTKAQRLIHDVVPGAAIVFDRLGLTIETGIGDHGRDQGLVVIARSQGLDAFEIALLPRVAIVHWHHGVGIASLEKVADLASVGQGARRLRALTVYLVIDPGGRGVVE